MEETFESSSTSPNETNCYTWNNADFKYLSRTFDVFGYFALLFLVIYIVMNSLIFCCGQKHIFRSAILRAKFRKFIQHRARKLTFIMHSFFVIPLVDILITSFYFFEIRSILVNSPIMNQILVVCSLFCLYFSFAFGMVLVIFSYFTKRFALFLRFSVGIHLFGSVSAFVCFAIQKADEDERHVVLIICIFILLISSTVTVLSGVLKKEEQIAFERDALVMDNRKTTTTKKEETQVLLTDDEKAKQ